MQLSNMVGLYNSSQGAAEVNSQVGVQKLVSALSDMKAGNIFEGTINSVKNGQVVLGLSNGQTISARLDGSVSVTQGQSLFFQVKSNDGATIAIRPFTVEGSQVNLTLMNALGAANLSINQQNLSMVNSMMENSMPIDRDSLNQMARLMSNHPTANADTLVQMTKLDLPTTPEMISQFENYSNDKQAITVEMDRFMEELPNALANENLSGGEIAKMAGDVLGILTENLGTSPDANNSNADIQNLPAQNSETANAEVANAEVANVENANSQASTLGTTNPEVINQEVANQEVANQEAANQEALNQEIANQGAVTEELANADGKTTSAQPGTLGAMFDSNQLSALTNNLFEANLLPDNQMLQPEQNAMQLLSNLASFLPNMSDADKESLMKLFTSVEFKELTKEAMQQQWTLKPEQLSGADSEKISKLYENLKDQLNRIENAVKATGQQAGSLTETAATIRNNVDFMNQVNQTVSYIQIPLQMNGKNASGELYVYRNKKELSDPEGELSAFLHLDMDHLGSTDVSIKMKNKNVDTKFYFDNDASFALISEYSNILEERLLKKGYNCSVSVVNEKKHVNVIDDLMNREKGKTPLVHRYSFDMRA